MFSASMLDDASARMKMRLPPTLRPVLFSERYQLSPPDATFKVEGERRLESRGRTAPEGNAIVAKRIDWHELSRRAGPSGRSSWP